MCTQLILSHIRIQFARPIENLKTIGNGNVKGLFWGYGKVENNMHEMQCKRKIQVWRIFAKYFEWFLSFNTKCYNRTIRHTIIRKKIKEKIYLCVYSALLLFTVAACAELKKIPEKWKFDMPEYENVHNYVKYGHTTQTHTLRYRAKKQMKLNLFGGFFFFWFWLLATAITNIIAIAQLYCICICVA